MGFESIIGSIIGELYGSKLKKNPAYDPDDILGADGSDNPYLRPSFGQRVWNPEMKNQWNQFEMAPFKANQELQSAGALQRQTSAINEQLRPSIFSRIQSEGKALARDAARNALLNAPDYAEAQNITTRVTRPVDREQNNLDFTSKVPLEQARMQQLAGTTEEILVNKEATGFAIARANNMLTPAQRLLSDKELAKLKVEGTLASIESQAQSAANVEQGLANTNAELQNEILRNSLYSQKNVVPPELQFQAGMNQSKLGALGREQEIYNLGVGNRQFMGATGGVLPNELSTHPVLATVSPTGIPVSFADNPVYDNPQIRYYKNQLAIAQAMSSKSASVFDKVFGPPQKVTEIGMDGVPVRPITAPVGTGTRLNTTPPATRIIAQPKSEIETLIKKPHYSSLSKLTAEHFAEIDNELASRINTIMSTRDFGRNGKVMWTDYEEQKAKENAIKDLIKARGALRDSRLGNISPR